MNSSNELTLPTIADIKEAAGVLEGNAVKTPLLESPLLNEKLGGRLFIKAECLQRTGSFKFRGAFNCISHLDAESREKGVVAFSSGNHAQGVAAAAQFFGIPAVIVMPRDAPAMKIANTKAYGAEVILYDRETENREAVGEAVQKQRGMALVRPYDDFHVIAGQGTTGLEIADRFRELDLIPDAVAVPCSGGGLVGGTALALRDTFADVSIHSAEPEDFNDTALSLAAGERIQVHPKAPSICDALLMPTPGMITFRINRHLLSPGVVASDTEARQAMRVAFEYFKIVVEPGGAVALAAVLNGQIPIKGRNVAVVCSGGNVDPDAYRTALTEV